MMRVNILTTIAEMKALLPQWVKLFEACPAKDLFLSPEWTMLWLEHFGAAHRLLVLTFWDGDELIGLMPFKSAHGYFRVLTMAGLPQADRVDFLLRPGRETEILSEAARWLARRSDWDMIFLRASGVFSQNPELFEQALAVTGRPATLEQDSVYPFVSLHDYSGGEAYISSREKKRRKEFRRTMRMIESELPDMRFTVQDHVDEALFAQMADINCNRSLRAERGECYFDHPERVTFLRHLADEAQKRNQLRVFGYVQDGVWYSYLLCFVFENKLYPYVTSFDKEYSRYGIGALTILSAINYGIENDMAEFDFLEGAEHYKFHFTGSTRRGWRLVSCNKTIRGRMLSIVMHHIKPRLQQLDAGNGKKSLFLEKVKAVYRKFIH